MLPPGVDQPCGFLPLDSALQPEGLHRTRGVARSGLRPLPKISTAASRRSLASVSVPVARVVLSHPLAIFALVGRYPANKLIAREPLPRRNSFPDNKMSSRQIARYYPPVREAIPVPRVGYPRLTAPFATSPDIATGIRSTCMPNPRRQRSF